jgi:hypothetical protein
MGTHATIGQEGCSQSNVLHLFIGGIAYVWLLLCVRGSIVEECNAIADQLNVVELFCRNVRLRKLKL